METPVISKDVTEGKNNGNFNKTTMIILTILGGTTRGKKLLNYTKDEALVIYRRLITFSIIIAILYFFSFIANVVGFKGVNYFPFFIFVIVLGILRIHPVHNAIVAFFGALIEALETNSSLSKGAIKYLQYYQGYFSQFISYGALVFWALAVIPLEGNAMNSLAIFSTIIMLLIMGIGGNLCRYLINIFVITVLIYFSYQAVSQSFKDFTSKVSANTETVCGKIYNNFIDYLDKPDKTDEPKDEIARLKAAAEETARKLSENGNGNSNNELLEIAAPGTFPFKLDPHEKVKRKIFVKENLRFSITSSRTDGDFYLILHDRGDQIFHITKYYKTLPEYAGTFSVLNGEKETTITLLVY